MKKWIAIITGLALLVAAAVETVVRMNAPTVSNTADILDVFYKMRESIPPLPPPVNYETVASQMAADRFDFLAAPGWAFTHSGGVLYLADNSELKLPTPMQLVVYEDLMSGTVVLSGTPVGSKKVQTLAIVDAPEFKSFAESGFVSRERYLMDQIGPRRIIWTALLKEESAWYELQSATLVAAAFSSLDAQTEMSAPMAMAMSSAGTDDLFKIIQDGESLSVNIPGGFVDTQITLYRRTNLLAGSWVPISTNTAVSNGAMSLGSADIPELIYQTNVTSGWVDCPNHDPMDFNDVCTNQTYVTTTNRTVIGGGLIFYRATATGDGRDTDGDGLSNILEYEWGANWQDIDSDGDGLLDGEEVDGGFDPATANDVPEEFASGMQSATNGVFVVLPERCWHAQESSLNLETYGAYSN